MKKEVDITKQTNYEIAVMRKMIGLYCRGNHLREDGSKRNGNELCSRCDTLLRYALARIDACPVKDTKDFCSNCAIHCYSDEQREQIRVVMRYSGPRMLFHAPITAIRHLLHSRKQSARKRR